MKKTFRLLVICAALGFGLLSVPSLAEAKEYDLNLRDRLMGKILLQVEEKGEAWYVNPDDGLSYYMATGDDAYQIMRYLSLGIADDDLTKIPPAADANETKQSHSVCEANPLADRLKGNILLQVESLGQAWYVDPATCLRIYLKDGAAAYDAMRYLGLGITNENLDKLPRGMMAKGEQGQILYTTQHLADWSTFLGFSLDDSYIASWYPNDFEHVDLEEIDAVFMIALTPPDKPLENVGALKDSMLEEVINEEGFMELGSSEMSINGNSAVAIEFDALADGEMNRSYWVGVYIDEMTNYLLLYTAQKTAYQEYLDDVMVVIENFRVR